MSGFKTKARTVELLGRIDINTEKNPMLEDKSSREGLIENAYYFYDVLTSTLDKIIAEKEEIYYRVETYKKQQFVIPGHLKQYFSESLLAAITEKNQSIQANCKELFLLIEDSVTQTSFVLTNLIDEWISTLTELAQTKPQQIKKMLLDRLEAIIIANRNSLDDICQHSLDIRDGLLSDISPVLELLASIRNNNAVMETSDWIEAQRLIESVAQIKSEIQATTLKPSVQCKKMTV